VRTDVVVLAHELLQCLLQFIKVAAEDPAVGELPDDGGVVRFDLFVDLGDLGGRMRLMSIVEYDCIRGPAHPARTRVALAGRS